MIVGLTSVARVNPYATLLIDELRRRQVPVDFVLSAERGHTGDLWERWKRRGFAGALEAIRRRAGGNSPGPQPLAEAASERGLDLSLPMAAVCKRTSTRLLLVQSLASRETADAVRARSTEVLINAGGGLFRRRLLEAPSRGLLNAHMARLPALRGVDVLEWSLLLGEAPGVTVHWIDGGVDTGMILGFSPLEVATDETLESLRERAVVLSARAIAEQVARLQQAEGTVETSGSNAVPQYFALHPRLRQRAAARLMENVD